MRVQTFAESWPNEASVHEGHVLYIHIITLHVTCHASKKITYCSSDLWLIWHNLATVAWSTSVYCILITARQEKQSAAHRELSTVIYTLTYTLQFDVFRVEATFIFLVRLTSTTDKPGFYLKLGRVRKIWIPKTWCCHHRFYVMTWMY